MPGKDPKVIDGFSSVQAVKRTGRTQSDAKLRHSSTRLPEAEARTKAKEKPAPAAAAPNAGAKIGHTAIPLKHEMVCYECLYAFTVSGKVHYAFCPKCKRNLDMSDHTLEGEWTTDVRTMGSIEIKPGCTVSGVLLLAQVIVVAGDVSGATLQATRRIELAPGGRVSWAKATMKDLLVRPGSELILQDPLLARTIDIAGSLSGHVRAEDLTTIRATGIFQGELYSPRLRVEDGAAIRATLFLGSAVATGAREKQHAA